MPKISVRLRETFRCLARQCMRMLPMQIIFQTTQHTATHHNTPQHTATYCNTLYSKPYATHCITLQHTATHYNTLQHTATRCNTHCIWNRMQSCLKVDPFSFVGVSVNTTTRNPLPPPKKKELTWKTSRVSCTSQIWWLVPRSFVCSFSMEMLSKRSRYPAIQSEMCRRWGKQREELMSNMK